MNRETDRARSALLFATTLVLLLGGVSTARAQCVTADGCTPSGTCAYTSFGAVAFPPSTWQATVFQLENPSGCVALPASGTLDSDFSLLAHIGVSSDPGNSNWSYGAGTAHLVVRVHGPTAGVYPLDVLAYDIVGFPLPSRGGIHLDPARASTGQITVTPHGAMLNVDCDFDVFLLLDRADGESPIPAAASKRVTLVPIAGDPAHTATWGSLKLHYR